MSIRTNDRVKARVKINGGAFKPDAKRGRKGIVLSTSWTGQKAKVHFEADGFMHPETTISDIPIDHLEKISY